MLKHVNPRLHLHRLVERLGSQAAAAKSLQLSTSYFSDLLLARRDLSDRVLRKLNLRRVVVREKKR